MADKTDVIQGSLDLLILKTLALEPLHGFGVARRIEQVSDHVLRVNPGSLLLAFRRLEREGLVEAEWRMTEKSRRACYYKLTAGGRRHLKTALKDWERRIAGVARVLEST